MDGVIMTIMNKEIYVALIEAGASTELASAAATSVCDYQKDIGDLNQNLAEIKGHLTAIKWGTALIIGVVVILNFKAFFGV